MTISLNLDKELEKKLKKQAELKKLPVTEVIKEALQKQLKPIEIEEDKEA